MGCRAFEMGVKRWWLFDDYRLLFTFFELNLGDEDEVIRQQKGIGRNLNQLTTLANMGKVNTVYLQELADAYAQVSSLLSEILKRRRWS